MTLSSVLKGASAGSGFGSFLGPIGTVAGGSLGGLAGYFGRQEQPSLQKFDQYTPQQHQVLQQLLQSLGQGGQLGSQYEQALGGLSELMDPSSESVQRFADPYLREFQEQTVPGLAERFAGAGAMGGGLSSSGFGQALGAAGGNLQSTLAALKSQLQQGAMQSLLNQYQSSLGQGLGAQPFGYMKTPGQPSFLSDLLGGYQAMDSPGAGEGLGFLKNILGV